LLIKGETSIDCALLFAICIGKRVNVSIGLWLYEFYIDDVIVKVFCFSVVVMSYDWMCISNDKCMYILVIVIFDTIYWRLWCKNVVMISIKYICVII
jgi:hypothetical protein